MNKYSDNEDDYIRAEWNDNRDIVLSYVDNLSNM